MTKKPTSKNNRFIELGLAWLKKLREKGVLGVMLLALSIVTFIGLLNRTSGTLIDWWSNVVMLLFGWGSYVVVLVVATLGLLLAIGRMPRREQVPWRIVVGTEVMFLALTGLVHLFVAADTPWETAQEGNGGGYVGAVLCGLLVEVLGPWPAGIVLGGVLVSGALLTSGLSVQEWVDRIEDWAWEIKEWAVTALARKPKQAVSDGPGPGDAETGHPAALPPQPAADIPLNPTPFASLSATSAPRSQPKRSYKEILPPLDLLCEPAEAVWNQAEQVRKARIIEETLAHFDVPAQVVETNWGPRVTQFGVEPGYITRKAQNGEQTERKIRVSKIASLSNDLALALAASPVRIEAPVPGRSIVGIEVPNEEVSVVSLRKVMQSKTFRRRRSRLKLALGDGVAGQPVVADLAKMPHLLIAGATGSGKSACINAIATSLLFQNSPLTLRLVMIDPKRVELSRYNGLPHLYGRVEVDVERVVGVLKWLVKEMEGRYKKLAEAGARHMVEYNQHWRVGGQEYMPRIVVLIDEMADLMFFAPEEAEKAICRLAQMARATGIHLVLATQRPSVDVVTGLIKANFPARIGFAVSSGTDSRVVLDTVGAETLLGKGDMLYMSPSSSKLVRIQGSFVTEEESALVVGYWRNWADEQEWQVEPAPWEAMPQPGEEIDELLGKAVEIVREQGSASASMLQRRMHIGYPRAARLIEELEELGIVGPAQSGGRPRDVVGFEAETQSVEVKET